MLKILLLFVSSILISQELGLKIPPWEQSNFLYMSLILFAFLIFTLFITYKSSKKLLFITIPVYLILVISIYRTYSMLPMLVLVLFNYINFFILMPIENKWNKLILLRLNIATAPVLFLISMNMVFGNEAFLLFLGLIFFAIPIVALFVIYKSSDKLSSILSNVYIITVISSIYSSASHPIIQVTALVLFNYIIFFILMPIEYKWNNVVLSVLNIVTPTFLFLVMVIFSLKYFGKI